MLWKCEWNGNSVDAWRNKKILKISYRIREKTVLRQIFSNINLVLDFYVFFSIKFAV